MISHLEPLDSTCDPCVAFLPGTEDALVLSVGCVCVCLWLYCIFAAAHGLSLVAVSGVCSSFQNMGFSLWWLRLLQSTGSRVLKLQ